MPDPGDGGGGGGPGEDPKIWVLTVPSVVAAIQQGLSSAFTCIVNAQI